VLAGFGRNEGTASGTVQEIVDSRHGRRYAFGYHSLAIVRLDATRFQRRLASAEISEPIGAADPKRNYGRRKPLPGSCRSAQTGPDERPLRSVTNHCSPDSRPFAAISSLARTQSDFAMARGECPRNCVPSGSGTSRCCIFRRSRHDLRTSSSGVTVLPYPLAR